MPVYNVENRVEQSLLSALNQTFESIEYLVIDDKGVDNSIGVVKKIKETHPRGKHIRIVEHEKNIGTGATKNSAIKFASGDYLYFMDSDDLITPDCIETLYAKAQKTSADVISGSYVVLNEDLSYNNSVYLGNIDIEKSLSEYYYVNNGCWNIQTWNKLYKLSFLKKNNIKCIPHHLCEDVFFQFQVIQKCKKFVSCNMITYVYVLYGNSSTAGCHGYRLKFAQQYREALKYEVDYIKKESIEIDSTYVSYGILKSYQFLLSKIRNSSLIDQSEKDELVHEIALDLESIIKEPYFKKYIHLKDIINQLKLDNITICFEKEPLFKPRKHMPIYLLMAKLVIKARKMNDKLFKCSKRLTFINTFSNK